MSQAIIGAIGDIDKPLGVKDKGWASLSRHLTQHTPEMRQRWRDDILETSADDFMVFSERLRQTKQLTQSVVGSRSAIEDAQQQGHTIKLTEVL